MARISLANNMPSNNKDISPGRTNSLFFVFLSGLLIACPSFIVPKENGMIYPSSFASPSEVETAELKQELNKPGIAITLLEGGGVPVGLNTKKTLQMDVLNKTEKA